jgi:hypothetical protein
MALEPIPGYSGLPGGLSRRAYNEAAFQYFLSVERRRAQGMQRSILLVLASIRMTPGHCEQLRHSTAAAMFAGLAAVVREVDFLGWYRQGRVAGAVLAQPAYLSDPQQVGLVGARILEAIRREIHDGRGQFVHVRVVRLGFKEGDDDVASTT